MSISPYYILEQLAINGQGSYRSFMNHLALHTGIEEEQAKTIIRQLRNDGSIKVYGSGKDRKIELTDRGYAVVNRN